MVGLAGSGEVHPASSGQGASAEANSADIRVSGIASDHEESPISTSDGRSEVDRRVLFALRAPWENPAAFDCVAPPTGVEVLSATHLPPRGNIACAKASPMPTAKIPLHALRGLVSKRKTHSLRQLGRKYGVSHETVTIAIANAARQPRNSSPDAESSDCRGTWHDAGHHSLFSRLFVTVLCDL